MQVHSLGRCSLASGQAYRSCRRPAIGRYRLGRQLSARTARAWRSGEASTPPLHPALRPSLTLLGAVRFSHRSTSEPTPQNYRPECALSRFTWIPCLNDAVQPTYLPASSPDLSTHLAYGRALHDVGSAELYLAVPTRPTKAITAHTSMAKALAPSRYSRSFRRGDASFHMTRGPPTGVLSDAVSLLLVSPHHRLCASAVARVGPGPAHRVKYRRPRPSSPQAVAVEGGDHPRSLEQRPPALDLDLPGTPVRDGVSRETAPGDGPLPGWWHYRPMPPETLRLVPPGSHHPSSVTPGRRHEQCNPGQRH